VRFADETASFLPFGAAPQLRASLDLGYTEVAALLIAMPAGGVLGLALAVLADAVSRRRLAALSTAVLALTMAAFAVSESFVVLVVAAFVYGAASDGMVSAIEVSLADLAGDDLDRAIARTNVFGVAGDLLGPVLLGAAVIAGIGVRPVFGLAALALSGYAWWLARLSLPAPRHPGREHVRGRLRAVVTDRRVWAMGALAACIAPLDEALIAAFLLHLAEGAGRDQPVVLVAVASVAGGVLGLAAAPWVIRRLGRPRAMAAGTLVIGISVAGAAIGPAGATVVAAVVSGFGISVAWVAFQAIELRLRPGSEGTTGAVVGALELPGLLVPVLAGVVADRAGTGAALAVFAALGVVGGVLAAATTRLLRRQAAVTLRRAP
jgi:predicted MFS family arabinose efflux permease